MVGTILFLILGIMDQEQAERIRKAKDQVSKGFKLVSRLLDVLGFLDFAKKNKNDTGVGVLISDLCCQGGVQFVAKIDTDVTSTTSTDIRRIESEYTKDESKRRKKNLVYTSPVVDVEAIEADTTQSSLAVEPAGIPSYFTSTAPAPSTASRTPLTHAMIYKLGNLTYSIDKRALRVEANVPLMIDRAIAATLAPFHEELIVQQDIIMAHGLALDVLTIQV
uniref:Integrase core domain containing protein n=1 Tax=Solanum tuberosum TaxID=4113 RepID=M1DK50_SOLTU